MNYDWIIFPAVLLLGFFLGWFFRHLRFQAELSSQRRMLQSELVAAQRARDQAIKSLAKVKARWHESEKSKGEHTPARFEAKEGQTVGDKQASENHSDDLKRISGIGPKLEQQLHELGIFRYAQIAAFDAAEIQRIEQALGAFKGRIKRDNWVAQAASLI